MKKFTVTLFVLVFSIMLQAQTSEQEYLFKEWNDYFKGVYELPKNNAKAISVYQQLVNYSGMQFYIRYAQTFTWGQAHNGGIILLDYSAMAKPKAILAFIMAHEWGHEALGHAANLYNPYGNVWKFAKGQTEDEDAADVYAGRFLASLGYDVTVVTNFLRNLPPTSPWDSHSSGNERADHVMEGYNSVDSPSQTTQKYQTVQVPCSHPQHPAGDLIPCSHPVHPMGDVASCNHPCADPYYGAVPCHPNGDVYACSHPAHFNDGASPCVHPLHPFDLKTIPKY